VSSQDFPTFLCSGIFETPFSPFGFVLLKAVRSQKSIMPAYKPKPLNWQTCKDRKASMFLLG
jgi:hypothetical protein